jgi:hypothetical protein
VKWEKMMDKRRRCEYVKQRKTYCAENPTDAECTAADMKALAGVEGAECHP